LDEFNPSTVGDHVGIFGEGFGGVVAAFDVDIGLEGVDQVGGAEFGEEDNGINGLETGEEFGALSFGNDGAGGLTGLGGLELGDGCIAIEADDEALTVGFGGGEVAEMAHMEEIKTAVGEDQRPPVIGVGGDRSLEPI
jgi:hypothetical protein